MDRLISLGVGTNGAADYFSAFNDVTRLAKKLGATHNYLNLTVQVVDDEPDEEEGEVEKLYYDEDTLSTVRAVLKNQLDDVGVEVAINDLQNAGILFRERPRKAVDR